MKSFFYSAALFVKILIVGGLLALTGCADTTLEELKQDSIMNVSPAKVVSPNSSATQSPIGNNPNTEVSDENPSGGNSSLQRGRPPKPSSKRG